MKYLILLSSLFLNSLHADWTISPSTIDSGNASSSAQLVVDSNGNVTSAWLENYGSGDDPQTAFFSMQSQQWRPPQNRPVAGAGLTAPQLIVDRFGTVTLVWLEYFNEHGNSITLFASRSQNGSPWTTPVPLNSLPGHTSTNALFPVSMAVDTHGTVVVAWLENVVNSSQYALGTARFTADITTPPTLYPSFEASANVNPQLVVDSLGYVTAVWQEREVANFLVKAARLDPSGLAWSAPTTLNNASLNANSSITPQMVVDASGIVTVTWQEISGSSYSVQAARFTPGAGGAGGSWTTYTTIAPALDNAYGSITPQIIVDAQGAVTIVALDSSLSVWPAYFAAGSWIAPASPLNTDIAFSLTPLSLVVDASGTVTVAWIANISGSLFVQTARGSSTTWQTYTVNGGSADSNTPLLMVIDTSGAVTISWAEELYMQATRFEPTGSSWADTATLNGGALYIQIPPKIVVGQSGAVTVAWQEGPLDGLYSIQASRFTPQESSWSSTTTLNNGTQQPHAFDSSMTQQINMVVDIFDNVTVTWLEFIDPLIAVQAARFSTPFTPQGFGCLWEWWHTKKSARKRRKNQSHSGRIHIP